MTGSFQVSSFEDSTHEGQMTFASNCTSHVWCVQLVQHMWLGVLAADCHHTVCLHMIPASGGGGGRDHAHRYRPTSFRGTKPEPQLNQS